MPEPEACLLRIHGLVQGVGYRHALRQQALALGLTGWVRNHHDGSVEALISGAPAAVAALRAWAGQGPALARVSRIDVIPAGPAEQEEIDECAGTFNQRATE